MPAVTRNRRPLRALLVALAIHAPLAWSAEKGAVATGGEENPPHYKLTLGAYRFSSADNAQDLNLRNTSVAGNSWLGYYWSQSRSESQWRAGWDRSFGGALLRFAPSLQIASQGYAAVGAQVEAGEPWYVGVGLGRTNLRDNWNLNFDPNDAFTLAAGHREPGGANYSVQWIQDNRLNPDQRHVHFVYQTPRPGGERLTLDLLYKRGLVDDVTIQRWGATAAYDWPRFFVRVAYDPKVNFTSDDMWRLSIGTRF